MELMQIDAATCVILVTLILWVWTRLKLPIGCHLHEAAFRRQNYHAYWAFGSLVALEALAGRVAGSWVPWCVGLTSGLVFYFFAIASFRSGTGFWSKRRNQILSLSPILATSVSAVLFIENSYFIPMFAAFSLGHICHKKYVLMVYSSIQDLETLQAKVLKQEANYANVRHFESLPSALRAHSQ